MRNIIMLSVGLVLSASIAMAAATAPIFGKPVIVGNGELSTSCNQLLAFDNTTIYAVFHNNGTNVVSSSNSGATWALSKIFPGSVIELERIAISKDPLYPGKTIVHAVWKGADTFGNAIYYAYKANRPTQSGWSKPVRAINLSTPALNINGVSLAVSSSGAVHILMGNKYAVAKEPDSAFSLPVEIQPDVGSSMSLLSIDAANNLYVIKMSYDTRTFSIIKKAEDAVSWSTPVEIYTASAPDHRLSGHFDFVVLDANNIYLAAFERFSDDKGNLVLFISTNGGSSWVKRMVVDGTVQGRAGENNPTIAVSANKTITYASEIYDADGQNPVIKVWRSNDFGVNWSAAAIIKGNSTPHLSMDASGKVNILVKDVAGNLLWSKEK